MGGIGVCLNLVFAIAWLLVFVLSSPTAGVSLAQVSVKLLIKPPAFIRTRASKLRRLIETRCLLETRRLFEHWPQARCIY